MLPEIERRTFLGASVAGAVLATTVAHAKDLHLGSSEDYLFPTLIIE